MYRRCIGPIALVCTLATVTQAAAQVLPPPPRSQGGLFGGPASPDPNRTGHELSATLNALGSYEDPPSPTGGGVPIGGGIPGSAFLPAQSGTVGVFATSVRHRYGNTTSYIETNGNGYMHSFRNLDTRPMYGGSGDVRAATQFGARATLAGGASAMYQPTFTLNGTSASGPAIPGGTTAPVDPTNGATRLRVGSGTADSQLTYRWNGRHRSSASYGYAHNSVTGVAPTTSQTHVSAFDHSWGFRRTANLILAYQHSGYQVAMAQAAPRPVDTNMGRVGLEVRKRLSRSRTISLNGGSGALHVSTISTIDGRPFEYVAPSFFGGARLDLGQSWSMSADVRRDVTVLEGVTQQSFLTNVASIWLGGNVGSRWVFSMNGSISDGRGHASDTGSFRAIVATSQLQYALWQCCSLLGSYSYYDYQLRDLSSIPAGFPSRSERSAVRMGVTVWLPLYGRFSQGRTPATRRTGSTARNGRN